MRLCLFAFLLALGCLAQKPAKPHASARDLFLGNAGSSTPAAFALRYSILKKSDDGSAAEEDSDAVFHSGDRFRLRIEVNDAGYLYVVERGSSNTWSLIYPTPESSNTNNLVDRGQTYDIPEDVWFEFDKHAGVEKLFIVFSREPEPDIKKQLQPSEEKTKSLADAVVIKIRNEVKSRDLVFEKVSGEGANHAPEKALYVAVRGNNPGSRLVLDVSLNHR